MEPRPSKATERRKLQEAALARTRRTSIIAGVLGLVLLFAGGIAIIVLPLSALALLGVMGAGIILLIVAFVLARGRGMSLP